MSDTGTNLTLDDLVTKYSNTDNPLNGWDVLVGYQEAALNKLLLAQHAAAAPETFKISFSTKSFVGALKKNVTYNYTLELKSPALSLSDDKVTISFAVGGKWDCPDTTTADVIADGVKMKCETKFEHVQAALDWVPATGSTSSSGSVISQAKTPAGQPVTFGVDATEGGHTVIDMTDSVAVTIVDKDGNAGVVEGNDVMEEIQKHFKNHALVYRFGTIANSVAAGSGKETDLKPGRFLMTSVVGNPKVTTDSSSILFWINLGTSTTGHDNRNNGLQFKVKDVANSVSSVPQTYTASVIISTATVRAFLTSRFEALGYSEVKFNDTQPSTGGLDLTAKPASSEIKINSWTDPNESSNNYNEIKFDTNSAAANIHVGSTGSKMKVSYTVHNCPFQVLHFDNFPSPTGGAIVTKSHQDGKMACTFSADAAGTWTSDANSNNVSLAFAFPTNFTVDIQKEPESTGEAILNFFRGGSPQLFSEIYKIKPAIPATNVELGALNYFLTTNLLFPGKHVFNMDTVDKGFKMPGALILAGNLVGSLT